MSDSGKPVEPALPTESTAIVTMNRNGKEWQMKKDNKGRFQKRVKTLSDTRSVTEHLRGRLTKVSKGGEQSELDQVFDNLVKIATTDFTNVVFGVDKQGKPIQGVDAKMAMASVKAAELIFLRSYGKPSVSDEELDALKRQGVKVVVIEQPQLMHPEVHQEVPRENLKPSFIEGEVVSTNDPPKQ